MTNEICFWCGEEFDDEKKNKDMKSLKQNLSTVSGSTMITNTQINANPSNYSFTPIWMEDKTKKVEGKTESIRLHTDCIIELVKFARELRNTHKEEAKTIMAERVWNKL